MTNKAQGILVELDGTVRQTTIKEGDKDWLPFTNNTKEKENEWKADNQRQARNNLLAETDWTQQPDISEETRTKWQSYRQALRDLPTHKNWPNIEESDLPTKPT